MSFLNRNKFQLEQSGKVDHQVTGKVSMNETRSVSCALIALITLITEPLSTLCKHPGTQLPTEKWNMF